MWRVSYLALLSISSLAMGQYISPVRNSGAGGGGGPTAFTYVASSVTGCIQGNAGATACQFTLHQTPGAGHLLVMMATWADSGAQSLNVTGTQTWTAIGSKKVGVSGLAGFSGQMFFVPSATASATTVTATISTGTTAFIAWEVAEYSYTGTLTTLDPANATGFNYSNTAASGGVATVSTSNNTTGSSDLLIGACMAVDSQCTVGAGYTSRNDTTSCNSSVVTGTCNNTTGSINGDTGNLLEEKVNVTAGAQSATFGTGTTDAVILGIAAFGK